MSVYDYLKENKKITYSELEKNFGEKGIEEITQLIKEGKVKLLPNEPVVTYEIVEEVKIEISKEEEIISEIIKNLLKEKKKEKTIAEIANEIINLIDVKKEKEREEIAKEIWLGLPIQNIKTYKVGEENFYEFEVNGKTFKLNDVFSEKIWKRLFFEEFGIVLPKAPPGVFTAFLMWFRANAEKIEKLKDIESVEENAREAIINYINNSFITEKVEEALIFNYVYVNGDRIYVPSDVLKRVLKSKNIKISLKRLAFCLKDLLAGGSMPFKIGNETKRFWVFDRSKFNPREKVEEKEEEKDKENDSENSEEG
jgi:hypothetical protein